MKRIDAKYDITKMALGEILLLKKREFAPILVNTSAIEQHGPHLPVGMDAIIGEIWMAMLLERIASRFPCYIGPRLIFGKSNEHSDFPGTLCLSAKSLSRLVKCTCKDLVEMGFKNIILFNTHGGNLGVLGAILNEIKSITSVLPTLIHWYPKPLEHEGLSKNDIHAGERETSWMLYSAPELCKPELAVDQIISQKKGASSIGFSSAKPAMMTWKSSEFSRSGVLGEASQASKEKGEKWMKEGIEKLLSQIETLYLKGKKEA